MVRLPFVCSAPRRAFASVNVLASTAAAALLAPIAAQAQLAPVVVNGYEIRTVVGLFGRTGVVEGVDLRQQPWWNNRDAATLFAGQVGNALGLPNFPDEVGTIGPFFGYLEEIGGDGRVVHSIAFDSGEGGLRDLFVGSSINGVWAYASRPAGATTVPVPLPVFGAAAAFGISRQLRRRIKATRTPVPAPPAL